MRAPRVMLCTFATLVLAAACAREEAGPPKDDDAGRAAAPAAATAALIPATATLDDVNKLAHDPTGPEVARLLGDTAAAYVRRGYQIVRQTPQHAPEFSGNALSCANCHLNAGQKEAALPYVGIAGLFPQYRTRAARLISLEDRIRGCFSRSMNGTPPPYDSEVLLAISAYITWLSRDQPVGKAPAWRGRNQIAKERLIAVDQLDVQQGQALYARQCAVCHGADGQGVDLKTTKPGPLWGPGSWNDGAGAARVYTLAGYIRYAMPLTSPGSLTDEEAQHIAAFVNAHERPVFAGKSGDYKGSEVPVDAVYYPQRYRTNPLMAKLRQLNAVAAR